MNNASGTNRSDHHVLRLVPTGSRLAVEKIELLLAEKHGALSLIRTSVAVLALPLAILTVMVVASGHYQLEGVLHLAVPLLAVCVILVGVGAFLFLQGLDHLRRIDARIDLLKDKSGPLADAIL